MESENTKSDWKLSQDDALLYDRQLRLWGLEGQRRIGETRVLLIGMKGLHNEVAKNLVLSGIQQLVVMDNQDASEAGSCVYLAAGNHRSGLRISEAVLESLHDLNPRVQVEVASSELLHDETFLKQFHVLSISQGSLDLMLKLSEFCWLNQIKFYAASVFGHLGWIFSCPGSKHTYQREFQQAIGKHSMDSSRPNDSSSETPNPVHQQPELKTKTIQKTETWCHLADALDSKPWINLSTRAIKRSFSPIYFFQRLLWILEKDSVDGDHAGFMQTHGQLFRDHFQLCIEDVFNQQWVEESLSNMGEEMSAVCTIVGAVLAQDVIRIVSGQGLPIRNWFFFDGTTCSGVINFLGPSVETAST